MGGNPLGGRRLGLVGAGKMAEALTRGVLAAGALPPESIVAADPDGARRELFESLGVRAVVKPWRSHRYTPPVAAPATEIRLGEHAVAHGPASLTGIRWNNTLPSIL